MDMEDKFKLITCQDNDVVEFEEYMYRVTQLRQALYKLSNSDSDLAQQLHQSLEERGVYINKSYQTLCDEGIDCEILNLGSQNWKKGKLRFQLSVEFYVEDDHTVNSNNDTSIMTEPDSPLDDLRRMINDSTS
ncbi:KGK domain-containing protein [Anabaena catenula]|nr:KGK domain-containing protein [Anabaena catenula]